MKIREDDLTAPAVLALVGQHLDEMAQHSPPESTHALGADALRRPDVTFWTAWDGPNLLGCAALKRLTPDQGEIKSMRTADGHRRRGVAAELLRHLIREAQRRGYTRLHLETGSMAAFEPARALYRRFGFVETGPFEDYRPDPNSIFMSRDLPVRRI